MKASGRYPMESTASSTPWAAKWPSTRSIIGCSTMGSICFGVVNVRGRSRVPSPPTRTTALTWRFRQSASRSRCSGRRGGRCGGRSNRRSNRRSGGRGGRGRGGRGGGSRLDGGNQIGDGGGRGLGIRSRGRKKCHGDHLAVAELERPRVSTDLGGLLGQIVGPVDHNHIALLAGVGRAFGAGRTIGHHFLPRVAQCRGGERETLVPGHELAQGGVGSRFGTVFRTDDHQAAPVCRQPGFRSEERVVYGKRQEAGSRR